MLNVATPFEIVMGPCDSGVPSTLKVTVPVGVVPFTEAPKDAVKVTVAPKVDVGGLPELELARLIIADVLFTTSVAVAVAGDV
jgi:hypothetical protein